MPAKPREPFDANTERRLKEFGEELRKARRRLGISRAALADELGMHLSNYARIERGKHNVTVEMVSRIADALGTELSIRFVPKS